jgi:hypothetical protein
MQSTDAVHIRQLMERATAQLEELRVLLVGVDREKHIDFKLTSTAVEVIRVDELPPILEHVFRETINNVRTALDRTVAYLAKDDTPLGRRHHGAFPIALSLEAYKKRVVREKALNYVPAAAASLIESVQPYHYAAPESHPLAILAELSNEDKHRYGQPAWGMISGLGVATVPDDGGTITMYELIGRSDPIGERRSLRVGLNLLSEFHPRVFEPFAAYLVEDGTKPGDLLPFARTSVGFGPYMLRWPELRDLLAYVNAEVVGPLTNINLSDSSTVS